MATPHDPPWPPELPLEPLRRLARGLVRDPGGSDDLVQEAWLAALQTRTEIRGLGGWLAGAMRRLARNRTREAGRREQHEHAGARPEAQPSAAEAAARIEVLRRLLGAVERLPAPYREAVVLRYFDELPPRVLARRLGVPVNTARTHVRRGLARLRADLDPGTERGRAELLAALVPLLGPEGVLPSPDPAPPRSSPRPHPRPHRNPMSPLSSPLALAASALTLVTLAWLVTRPGEPAPPLGAGGVARLEESATADPRPLPEAPARSAPSVATAPPSERAPLESGWTVRGRVTRDGLGALPGARLVGRLFRGGRPAGAPLLEERFEADAEGAFAWSPTPPVEGLFSLAIEGETPLHRGRPATGWFLAGDPAPEDWSLTLHPLDTTLRGTVRGADGAALAGAFVGLRLGDEATAVRSASDGSFELLCASALKPRFVCAWSAGLAPGFATLGTDLGTDLGTEITCEIGLAPELTLRGTVRGPDGAPLAGAEVVLAEHLIPAATPAPTPAPSGNGVRATSSRGPLLTGPWPRVTTDADGRYALGGVHPQASLVLLRASAPGLQPAERALGWIDLHQAEPGEHDLALAAGFTLGGRVRAGGEPAQAAWISVGDWAGELEGVEAWCDAEGRFTLANVPAGPQHLWIWRRGHAQLRHDVSVRAGLAALELELAPGHAIGGIVLGPDSQPRPWADLWVEDASGAEPPRLSGYGARTDAGGRFRIVDLPEARLALGVFARGCEPLSREVALDRDDLVLELRAAPDPGPAPGEPVPEPVVPVTAASGGASVAGRLLDLAGNGLASQEIELVAVAATPPAGPWRATTGTAGEFAIGGLPSGSFDARWVRREAGLAALDLETRLTLAGDEARELELQPRGRSTLRGTIELRDMPPGSVTVGYGTPPALEDPTVPSLVAVQLMRLAQDGPVPGHGRGTFAHDGRFELEGLAPGRYAIGVELVFPGHRLHGSQELEIPVGRDAEIVLGVFRP